MEYKITYRNQGKLESTPIMPDDTECNKSKHNVELLKIQGATSIKVWRIK